MSIEKSHSTSRQKPGKGRKAAKMQCVPCPEHRVTAYGVWCIKWTRSRSTAVMRMNLQMSSDKQKRQSQTFGFLLNQNFFAQIQSNGKQCNSSDRSRLTVDRTWLNMDCNKLTSCACQNAWCKTNSYLNTCAPDSYLCETFPWAKREIHRHRTRCHRICARTAPAWAARLCSAR